MNNLYCLKFQVETHDDFLCHRISTLVDAHTTGGIGRSLWVEAWILGDGEEIIK